MSSIIAHSSPSPSSSARSTCWGVESQRAPGPAPGPADGPGRWSAPGGGAPPRRPPARWRRPLVVLPTPPAPVVTRISASRTARSRERARARPATRSSPCLPASDQPGTWSARGPSSPTWVGEHVGQDLEVGRVEGGPGQLGQVEHGAAGAPGRSVRSSACSARRAAVGVGGVEQQRRGGGGQVDPGGRGGRPRPRRRPATAGGRGRPGRPAGPRPGWRRPGRRARRRRAAGGRRRRSPGPASPPAGVTSTAWARAGVVEHLLDLAGLALDRARPARSR